MSSTPASNTSRTRRFRSPNVKSLISYGCGRCPAIPPSFSAAPGDTVNASVTALSYRPESRSGRISFFSAL